jgi:hypothetical protein
MIQIVGPVFNVPSSNSELETRNWELPQTLALVAHRYALYNSAVQLSKGAPGVAKTSNRAASKSFFALSLLLDCPNYLHTALMNVASLETECIVFAEGLLLAHDFISDGGFRVQLAE